MSDLVINDRLLPLTKIVKLEASEFEKQLGVSLKQIKENPSWTFYEFESSAPFSKGEVRLSKDQTQALLVLTVADEPPVLRSDLDLSAWGAVRGLDPNPRIPPEGADAYIYEANGVKASFQFTHKSHRLLAVALEWG